MLAVLTLLLGFGAFPQEPLRRRAEARLRDAVGPASRLGGLRVTPFFLRADIRDLYLEGPGYALTVPEGRLVLAPRALVGALALESLEVVAPTLRLAPAAPDRPADATAAPLASLEIGTVAVRDGSVLWSDPARGELEVEGVAVGGAIGSGALTIDAPRGTWQGETTIAYGPARARLAVARELDIVLESLEARFGESRLTARGPLARRGAPALDVELEAELDLADAGPALDLPGLSGALDVTGRVEGPVEGLRVTLDARGAARWDDWPVDDLSLRLEARPGSRRGTARLEGRVLGGRLEGEARLEGVATGGHLRGRSLDLTRLPAEMRLPVHVTGADVELSWEGPYDGPLHVDLVTRGRGRLEDVTGRLEAQARGSVQPRDGTVDLEWSARLRGEASTPVALDLRLDTDGRLRGAWPPEVTGRLSGTVASPARRKETETTLAGTFTARGADLRANLNTHGPVDLTGNLQLRGDRIQALSLVADEVDLARLLPGASGRARLQLRASGPLPSPDLAARVSVAGLEWGGLTLGRLEIGAEGTAERADVRAALPDLSLGAEGEVWSEKERRLRGQAELHETPLAPLGSLLGIAEPPVGYLTATLAFELPLTRPAEAEATLDAEELEVVYGDRSLRAEPFRAELRDGRLAAQDVRVEGAGVSLDLTASAGLGEDEAVELRAWLEADLGVFPLPEGWTVTGTLGGAVGLAGTRARPSLEGALHAAEVVVRGPSLPDVEVDDMELHLGDDGLRIPGFTARVGTGRATLEGEVPYAAVWTALRGEGLSASHRARLSAAWQDVPLGPFEGGLAGELTLEGGLASLEEVEGRAEAPCATPGVRGDHARGSAGDTPPRERPADDGGCDRPLGARRPRGDRGRRPSGGDPRRPGPGWNRPGSPVARDEGGLHRRVRGGGSRVDRAARRSGPRRVGDRRRGVAEDARAPAGGDRHPWPRRHRGDDRGPRRHRRARRRDAAPRGRGAGDGSRAPRTRGFSSPGATWLSGTLRASARA